MPQGTTSNGIATAIQTEKGETAELKKQLEEVKIIADSAIQAVCPTNDPRFRLLDGKCLLFVNEMKNQNDAKLDCENYFANNSNGRLIEPKDANMNKLVYEEAKKVFGSDEYIWLGIDDISAEKQWSYSSSGQNVIATFWNVEESQPNGGDQDCVRFNKIPDGLWHDVACTGDYLYMYL